jgi:quercetin dioxygenase-like cupin family protein
MKTIKLIIALQIAALSISHAQMVDSNAKGVFQNTAVPKGGRAPESNFTGIVWLYPLASDSLAHWSIAKVTFEPGAYSKWHTHSGKQVLVIQEGTGYLKEKGKPIQVLKKGDVVTIQPGVRHWHGATPQNGLIQIVMNPETKNGVVTWLERVTEEEYRSSK